MPKQQYVLEHAFVLTFQSVFDATDGHDAENKAMDVDDDLQDYLTDDEFHLPLGTTVIDVSADEVTWSVRPLHQIERSVTAPAPVAREQA